MSEERTLRPYEETDGYPIAVDEEIRLVMRPDAGDFWTTVAATGGVVWLPSFLVFITGFGVAEGFGWPQMIGLTLVLFFVGFFAALFATAAEDSRLVVTDRGIYTREGPDRWFIPWSDIVSIDTVFPYSGPWRVQLRGDASVLDRLPEPGWWERVLLRRDGTVRHIGAGPGAWDLRGRQLQIMQDAMDDWAVENFGRDEEDDER